MISLDEVPEVSQKASCEIVPLDDALCALSAIDPRKGQIVELRFFGGMSIDEISEVLGISSRTVLREWDFAKTWLAREISGKNLFNPQKMMCAIPLRLSFFNVGTKMDQKWFVKSSVQCSGYSDTSK